MSLARTHSIALAGAGGHLVEIEADMVGLPDPALREARDRIGSAIVNSGERWPSRRLTVGLSPARAATVGGGAAVLRPGAASLAHHGCLFLGEVPEFGRGGTGRTAPATGGRPGGAGQG